MKKTVLLGLAYLVTFCSTLLAQDITGFWKTFRNGDQPDSIMGIYKYQDKYYGRVIGIYNDQGVMTDTIYTPQSRANKVPGTPYNAGLDILWVSDQGGRYLGRIMDPDSGDIYDTELSLQNGNLNVHVEAFISDDEKWVPAQGTDFPSDFKKPNMSEFVPRPFE